MDWIQSAYEHLYFPLFERVLKGRRTAALYRQALQTQWQSREELEASQLRSLNELLQHAKTQSPYWRDQLALPERLESINAIRDLPILRKADIREYLPSMIAEDHVDRIWRKSTGGSTGEPLHFAYTPDSFEWRVAMSLRGYGWAGAPPGSRQAYVWGVATTPPSTLGKVKERLHQRMERKRYFNCFDFDAKHMQACLAELTRAPPDALVGYTNPLYELARFALQSGAAVSVPAVLCAAEKVHPLQRKAITAAFGSDVFDTYGSREFMLIASECEAKNGLHVSMENLIVEVVDEAGHPVDEGQTGRLLVTDLNNYGMPFIRYEIGDLARATYRQCACGRGLQMIDDVVGRALDVIRTPSGKVIPGEFFPHLIKDFPEVQRFQVIQERIDDLQVFLQGVNEDIAADTLASIEKSINAALEPCMTLSLQAVSEIPLTATGKHRVTISRLQEQ